VSWPGINVRTSHLYRAEPPIGTNVRHCTGWVGSGADEPLREDICTDWWLQLVQIPSFVAMPKISRTNEKSGQGQMPDSLVVVFGNYSLRFGK
jgi:hypothetical protein